MNSSSDTTFLSTFMPHGQCYLWRPDILWLNVLSDGFIALAYFSIPIILLVFVSRRRDVPFPGLVVMFSAFILACGFTHLMGIWTVWNGNYGIHGILKAITAVISIATAIVLVPIVPRLLLLRSPAEMDAVNAQLKKEVIFHQETTVQLQRTETRLRRLLEQAPYGILIVNDDWNVTYANSTASTLFGFSNTQLNAMPMNNLVPGARPSTTSETGKQFDEDASEESRVAVLELNGRHQNGQSFPVELSISSIQAPDEKSIVLVTVQDIAERKLVAETHRERMHELSHISRLNTVGEMASGLAHELNQPLTAISANCDTALSIINGDSTIDPDLVEVIQENQSLAHRAGQIIRALRQLVKKDIGVDEAIDLNSLVNAMNQLIQPEARAAQVQVNLQLDPNLPSVLVSPVQIQQVLVNLERNGIEALKQIDHGRREMTIATFSKDHDKMVEVSVTDNGPGIAPSIGDDLFEPYKTTRSDGMGLGLSICRSIIQAHGGRLWLDRGDSTRTCFRFTLPATMVNL